MSKPLEIVILGDIVGRPGRKIVDDYLKNIGNSRNNNSSDDLITKSDNKADFVIANVENASHGFGLTQRNHNELAECGIDAFTSGNHIWDRKEIFSYIEASDRLIRPLNYPEGTPGVGSRIFDCNGFKIGIINLLGRVFMNPVDCPFKALEEEMAKLKKITPIVLIDFHAEATAEKISLGYFADSQGASVFVGTHTHVQTADEKVLNNGCAYISDVGFCGASEGVIGMDYESSFKRLKTCLPEKFDVAPMGKSELSGVRICIDKKSGKAQSIERIKFYTDYSEVN